MARMIKKIFLTFFKNHPGFKVPNDPSSTRLKPAWLWPKNWEKETKYYWENYKAMKKPGTGVVETFHESDEAVKVIKECEQRYKELYLPKFEE